MFDIDEIEEKLGIEIEVDNEMMDEIAKWKRMYMDNPSYKDEDVRTLNLPSVIAAEMAKLVTIELKSEVSAKNNNDSELIEELNKVYQEVIGDIRPKIEYAAALGGIMFKPYIDGKGNVVVDYTQADNFIPVRFDNNGDIAACIFLDWRYIGDKMFTKLEYHDSQVEVISQDGEGATNAYIVENYCFVKEVRERGLGEPCELDAVPEWGNLEAQVIFEELDHKLYTYFKMPLANQINMKSPLGVSIFSRADDMIKETDMLYTQMIQEYSRSKKRVFVSELMIRRDQVGNFVDIPDVVSILDADDDNFYQEFVPEIREESYLTGLNNMYRLIERACSLAYGTISDVEDVAKTATEIKTSKQKSYSTVLDIQKNLQKSMEELIEIIAYWLSLKNEVETPDYEVSFDFDDSLVVDNETEQQRLLLEVQAQIRTPESYLKEMYDMTEEEIIEVLPNMDKKLGIDDYDDFE